MLQAGGQGLSDVESLDQGPRSFSPNSDLTRITKWRVRGVTLAQSWAPKILIFAFPLVIVALNGSFLANRLGDLDTWFYYGHFTTKLGLYRDVNTFIEHDYYQTRLSFILPGWFIFHVFPTFAARFVHYYIYYIVISFSLLYVLRMNTSGAAALLATIMLGTDIYFIRSAGWNYVDIGVLCYLSLTFASLTAAVRSIRPELWVAAAGFCFACAVVTHLGSIVGAVPVVGYVWYSFDFKRIGLWRLLRLMSAALAGVIVCQILFGLLNILIWRTSFFFILEQIDVAKRELSSPTRWESLLHDFGLGRWLVMHIAVFVASISMLGAAALRFIRLTRFQIYCFSSVASLYLLCSVSDAFHMTEFLARQGLYMVFFMFSTYLAIGALLPANISLRFTYIAAALFTVSLVVRLYLSGGTEGAIGMTDDQVGSGVFPAWELGLVIGAVLSIAALVRRQAAAIIGLCGIAILSLFISWRFGRDDSIYIAHDQIQRLAGDNLPRFLIYNEEPLCAPAVSIVASFTERAWRLTGQDFPALSYAPWVHDDVFVISSSVSDYAAVQHDLASQVDTVKPLASMQIQRTGGDLWIHEFDVVNRVSLPATLAKFQARRAAIPGSALPSLVGRVEGNDRIAMAGETPKGILTYGPYARLAPGKYDILIRYSASGGENLWDVAVNTGADIVQSGTLADTAGEDREVHITVTFSSVVELEVRTYYQGVGKLKVSAIGITPRDKP